MRYSVCVKRLLFISILAITPAAANAQDVSEDSQAAREEAELRVEAEMEKLNSMAEALSLNLGQLHALRTICFTEQDQKWRSYAGQMIDLEAGDDLERRQNLIQAFNKGYYMEKDRHQSCDQQVLNDVAAISNNGRQLAGMLGAPYRED